MCSLPTCWLSASAHCRNSEWPAWHWEEVSAALLVPSSFSSSGGAAISTKADQAPISTGGSRPAAISIGGARSSSSRALYRWPFSPFLRLSRSTAPSAYAAYGIGITLVSFSIVIGFGFGIADGHTGGPATGCGQPELAMQAVGRSLRMASGAMMASVDLLAYFAGIWPAS